MHPHRPLTVDKRQIPDCHETGLTLRVPAQNKTRRLAGGDRAQSNFMSEKRAAKKAPPGKARSKSSLSKSLKISRRTTGTRLKSTAAKKSTLGKRDRKSVV